MPVFVRQPLLKPEVEEQLKHDLEMYWDAGLNGLAIAEKLGFGIRGPYEKLKPCYVYFYRRKFELLPRRSPPRPVGESRYKNSPKELKMLSFNEFERTLNHKLAARNFHDKRQRTFLILHYWTPLRKSEIYERTIDNFEIQPSALIIHLLRKKKAHKRTVKDEPIKIPRAFPLMDEVVEYLQKGQWGGPHNPTNRPWRISHWTAWKYVNSIFEGYYGHFFRFEFITNGLEDPLTSFDELVAKTGLHIVTIQKYVAEGMRHQDTFDSRMLERIEKENKRA